MKIVQSLQKIAIGTGSIFITLLFAVQPAKAILFNTFEFVDEFNSPGDTVTGTITFNSLSAGDSGTLAADSVVIDSVPSAITDDGDQYQLGLNVLDEVVCLSDDGSRCGSGGTFVRFVNTGSPLAGDGDSSSLSFSNSTAAVPFKFSPSLGLLLVGGLFGGRHLYRKHKASKVVIE